ncbi:Fimbrial protein [Burkholderia sp. lig30]|jgi:type 1 fimbria pilin|uniref:fimbrial protein n=1 Tax=Burkholderia sp. lig30 TaxID=1192124 RepID=UPI0004612D18|nr:fimbrial protein [Burkholderia sp. lig30]KDB09866.1 Fimbrial protein [Burkholderia sp. lig30]
MNSNRDIDATKSFKYLMRSFIVVLAAFGSNFAHAQATCRSTGPSVYQYFFSFGNLLVPPNAPNGTVLATATVDMPYECDANAAPPGGWKYEYFNTWRPSTIPNVGYYGTGAGIFGAIGIRVSNLDTGEVMTGFNSTPQEWGPPNPTTQPLSGTFRMKYELIKLSDTIYSQKNLPNGVIGIFNAKVLSRANTGRGYTFQAYWKALGEKITVMPQSCTVTTPSPNVRLPSVAASKLNAVGMTAGDTGFNIGLSCKSGSNVYVTLTDLTDPGNTGNQLTLAPGSSANGVKLRILKDGQALGYGPDSAAVGNTNQWYVGPSATTSSIPLSAQYISTGAVSGGTVKGVATFTMSYQ